MSNNENKIENIFGYISNKKEDNIIKKDFEKVLNSRFLDAIYFLNSDIKIGLEQYYNKLEDLIYFEGLGNLRQKSERINNLCRFIAKKLFSKILINNNPIDIDIHDDYDMFLVRKTFEYFKKTNKKFLPKIN